MKLYHIFLIGMFSVTFIACEQSENGLPGEDVTQEFLSQYNGDYQEKVEDNSQAGEKLSIHRDGLIEVTKVRQVGSKDSSTIPYPTVCSYILRGQIRYIVETAKVYRQRTDEKTQKTYLDPATHEMNFFVEEVELTNSLQSSTTSQPGCQNFANEMNNRSLSYSYGMELFGSGTLRLHTSGGGDYTGGDRTDSTLDEVFIRQ